MELINNKNEIYLKSCFELATSNNSIKVIAIFKPITLGNNNFVTKENIGVSSQFWHADFKSVNKFYLSYLDFL